MRILAVAALRRNLLTLRRNSQNPILMLKRLYRSTFAMRLASLCIGAYIRLVQATSRWTVEGFEHFDDAAGEGHGVILAFWHGRLLMAPAVRGKTDRRVFMLISAHRDGERYPIGAAFRRADYTGGLFHEPRRAPEHMGPIPAGRAVFQRLLLGWAADFCPSERRRQ